MEDHSNDEPEWKKLTLQSIGCIKRRKVYITVLGDIPDTVEDVYEYVPAPDRLSFEQAVLSALERGRARASACGEDSLAEDVQQSPPEMGETASTSRANESVNLNAAMTMPKVQAEKMPAEPQQETSLGSHAPATPPPTAPKASLNIVHPSTPARSDPQAESHAITIFQQQLHRDSPTAAKRSEKRRTKPGTKPTTVVQATESASNVAPLTPGTLARIDQVMSNSDVLAPLRGFDARSFFTNIACVIDHEVQAKWVVQVLSWVFSTQGYREMQHTLSYYRSTHATAERFGKAQRAEWDSIPWVLRGVVSTIHEHGVVQCDGARTGMLGMYALAHMGQEFISMAGELNDEKLATTIVEAFKRKFPNSSTTGRSLVVNMAIQLAFSHLYPDLDENEIKDRMSTYKYDLGAAINIATLQGLFGTGVIVFLAPHSWKTPLKKITQKNMEAARDVILSQYAPILELHGSIAPCFVEPVMLKKPIPQRLVFENVNHDNFTDYSIADLNLIDRTLDVPREKHMPTFDDITMTDDNHFPSALLNPGSEHTSSLVVRSKVTGKNLVATRVPIRARYGESRAPVQSHIVVQAQNLSANLAEAEEPRPTDTGYASPQSPTAVPAQNISASLAESEELRLTDTGYASHQTSSYDDMDWNHSYDGLEPANAGAMVLDSEDQLLANILDQYTNHSSLP